MPLFEFDCRSCQKKCEILVRDRAAAPACPHCGSTDLAKRISLIARGARDGADDFGADMGGCGDGACGMDMGGGMGGGCCGGSCSGHGMG